MDATTRELGQLTWASSRGR
ncbi:hypothetical protein CCACVL1_23039 [Corchorus capsularis]|uniref:Uncharacterized protein n=1 Tax=Corchorus capsularis TaxID=210143 RepID=A0A1R3GVQ1_COCAP|nr:hypothetical protein CCACVL1_23039 [Corchorus capsularis]